MLDSTRQTKLEDMRDRLRHVLNGDECRSKNLVTISILRPEAEELLNELEEATQDR